MLWGVITANLSDSSEMSHKLISLSQTSCVFGRVSYAQSEPEQIRRPQCSLVNRFLSSKNLTPFAYYSRIIFNLITIDSTFHQRLESRQWRFFPRDTKAIQNSLFKFCIISSKLTQLLGWLPGAKLTFFQPVLVTRTSLCLIIRRDLVIKAIEAFRVVHCLYWNDAENT